VAQGESQEGTEIELAEMADHYVVDEMPGSWWHPPRGCKAGGIAAG
jgi:hypothetical protein